MTEIIWTGKHDMTRSNQEMGTKMTRKITGVLLPQDSGRKGNQRPVNMQHKKVPLFIVVWN